MADIYRFEEKTCDRLQDEPWYSDYQSVCEVMNAGPRPVLRTMKFFEEEPDGEQLALAACKEHFEEYPGPPGTSPPSDERIARWIKSCWLTEDNMAHIREVEKREIEERPPGFQVGERDG